MSSPPPSYDPVITFSDLDREYEMLACDRILRGLWVPLMFAAGDVSQSLLNLQIPLQNRLLLGNSRWADIARQVGRDRGSLHKNRDEGVEAYPGPPPADARARILLDSLLQGPGAPVPIESLITHLGDALEWAHPTEEDSARVVKEEVNRWESAGLVQQMEGLIHAGASPLVNLTSEQDREAAVFMALPGLHPAISGNFRGEEGHFVGHLTAFFSPEDMLALGGCLGRVWEELGGAPRAPWQVPPATRGEYVLWNLRFVGGPVDEDLAISEEVAKRWLPQILMSTGPALARTLGHVDLLLDGCRKIAFEQAREAHGDGWTSFTSSWGISRAAFARWADYPSLKRGDPPQSTFAVERKARMVEARKLLSGRAPEYLSLPQIHTHLQKVRGHSFPLPETAEFIRTLALMGYIGRKTGPSGAELYRGFPSKLVTGPEEMLQKIERALGQVQRLQLILEAYRRGLPGSGLWGWTVAVPRWLIPDLADRLATRFQEQLKARQEPWHGMRPLQALEHGARPMQGMAWTWLCGFPTGSYS